MNLEIQVEDAIERDCDEKVLPINIGGIAGEFRSKDGFPAFYGPWASHTGYHSLFGEMQRTAATGKSIRELALTYFEKNEKLPFVVGREHTEFGWKSICTNCHGEIQIRLPGWHKGIVSAAIESYGMEIRDKLNNHWVFPKEVCVSFETAKSLLRPILRDHTRFACEKALAEEIDRRAVNMGYLLGRDLRDGAMQQSLF